MLAWCFVAGHLPAQLVIDLLKSISDYLYDVHKTLIGIVISSVLQMADQNLVLYYVKSFRFFILDAETLAKYIYL